MSTIRKLTLAAAAMLALAGAAFADTIKGPRRPLGRRDRHRRSQNSPSSSRIRTDAAGTTAVMDSPDQGRQRPQDCRPSTSRDGAVGFEIPSVPGSL